MAQRVVVVGGGVVGACSAYYLARAGFAVTVVDRGKFGAGCSHANCGYVCPSHVLPLAMPGAVWSTFKALFHRNSPLKVRPTVVLKNLGWFLETRSVTAKEKNLVMNLVWDATGSSHATRAKLFEESNALNVPLLLERVYNEYDRARAMDQCRYAIGLGPAPTLRYEYEIEQTWSDRKRRGEY